MKIGLVGNGARFAALTHLLRNHEVSYWPGVDPPSTNGDDSTELPAHVERVELEALKKTPLIFLCLPIHRLRPTGNQLGKVLTGRHILVHTTRNLELSTLYTPSRILGEETPTLRSGFLTGPFNATDALAGRPSSGVCVSEFDEVHELVQSALDAPGVRVYRAKDLSGAEAAAAYSRVIAMLVGVGRQMELGAGLEATLLTRGLAETAKFVLYRGGYESTAWGLAGCGNLFLDASSHNLNGDSSTDIACDAKIGAEFIRREAAKVSDVPGSIRRDFGAGADNLFNLIQSLARVPQESGLSLPILSHAVELVAGERSAAEIVKSLLEFPVYYE
ncbi:hypothetical protein [Bradymonas sediminis]|uniref:Uncharacterized protein n=1 Tax=Bradymonas sediminis TaxID=1548548 RepID=A0A2Z4FQF3_9DELT|nr:hypothetical protein [Bradymonas sediminis]AWV91257.1 hypothetical protein DN745_18755 [Bradymonas sediminis]TDP73825.1 glycerol-3-phosphate dehydrogenase [Bradymonas sediminis]